MVFSGLQWVADDIRPGCKSLLKKSKNGDKKDGPQDCRHKREGAKFVSVADEMQRGDQSGQVSLPNMRRSGAP